MKKLFILLVLGCCAFMGGEAQAQTDYQQRSSDCNAEYQKLLSELAQMRHDKELILQEYMNGQFCSVCHDSKTEIERDKHVSFSQHIAEDKDRHVVSATAQQIAAKRKTLDDQIRYRESAATSKKSTCDGIIASYQRSQQEAQARSHEAAQRVAQQRAQQQADEQQRQLAAQREREAEMRRQQEAERERMLAAERARQAQLAANAMQYQASISAITADTQAKLDAQRANSTLRDIPTYNRSSAQGTIASTSTSSLGKQAFGGGGGYLDADDNAPPKKPAVTDAGQDDEADTTAGKAPSPIAPVTTAGCIATFDVVEAQRLPPMASVAAIGNSCEVYINRRILDYRNQDAPNAQIYIDQYCTAVQEGQFDKLLINWHQLQHRRSQVLEQELTDCLYTLTKQHLAQFNSATTGANSCLARLRNNQAYYQRNRTVVENLQYKINSLQQQMQLWISPANPQPNNALNALRAMSSLGVDICNLANSIKP